MTRSDKTRGGAKQKKNNLEWKFET